MLHEDKPKDTEPAGIPQCFGGRDTSSNRGLGVLVENSV